jgi:hypothetical protein
MFKSIRSRFLYYVVCALVWLDARRAKREDCITFSSGFGANNLFAVGDVVCLTGSGARSQQRVTRVDSSHIYVVPLTRIDRAWLWVKYDFAHGGWAIGAVVLVMILAMLFGVANAGAR